MTKQGYINLAVIVFAGWVICASFIFSNRSGKTEGQIARLESQLDSIQKKTSITTITADGDSIDIPVNVAVRNNILTTERYITQSQQFNDILNGTNAGEFRIIPKEAYWAKGVLISGFSEDRAAWLDAMQKQSAENQVKMAEKIEELSKEIEELKK